MSREIDIADFHLLVVVSFDALSHFSLRKKREDWVRNHHTDRRIGNPARASFSQRAPREKLFDQKEKMTQINAFFRVPQASQHLAYFSLRKKT